MPREQRQHPKQSGRTVKIRKSQGQRQKKQALTADELYERAQAALAFDNYDMAQECMRDALELEPENLEVLDAYGALLAELGSSEQAVQVGRLLFGAAYRSCTAWSLGCMHGLDRLLATPYKLSHVKIPANSCQLAPSIGCPPQLTFRSQPPYKHIMQMTAQSLNTTLGICLCVHRCYSAPCSCRQMLGLRSTCT
jgi:hypothetical protein